MEYIKELVPLQEELYKNPTCWKTVAQEPPVATQENELTLLEGALDRTKSINSTNLVLKAHKKLNNESR
jgi:hypothetical protein